MAKQRKPRVSSQAVQVSIRVKGPESLRSRVTPELLQQAVSEFIENGENPVGFEITGVVWDKRFYQGTSKRYDYEDPTQFHDVLLKAKAIGLVPKVFSLASD